ncbi:hypothetical protein BS78_10G139200 [Paspalum vaginatum]|nr:hypothetical protein BS78_10G139200 [Paspalum vaginatum]
MGKGAPTVAPAIGRAKLGTARGRGERRRKGGHVTAPGSFPHGRYPGRGGGCGPARQGRGAGGLQGLAQALWLAGRGWAWRGRAQCRIWCSIGAGPGAVRGDGHGAR